MATNKDNGNGIDVVDFSRARDRFPSAPDGNWHVKIEAVDRQDKPDNEGYDQVQRAIKYAFVSSLAEQPTEEMETFLKSNQKKTWYVLVASENPSATRAPVREDLEGFYFLMNNEYPDPQGSMEMNWDTLVGMEMDINTKRSTSSKNGKTYVNEKIINIPSRASVAAAAAEAAAAPKKGAPAARRAGR